MRKHFIAVIAACMAATACVAPSGQVDQTTPSESAAERSTTLASSMSVPLVRMICRPGQVDINFASRNELTIALATDPAVAERIISARPWLSPSDLNTVAGIGPGNLAAAIATGDLCATPLTTPPPALDVCVGDRGDIQTLTKEQLVERFKLPNMVATAVVDARPFATLRHVVPERVPGLGRAQQRAVQAGGCLTPASITTATTDWVWSYPDKDATVVRDEYRLVVPAGSVTALPGAWASITDAEAPPPLDGPSADFHIWGEWSAATTGGVLVTVPRRTLPFEPTQEWIDTVVHYRTDGRSYDSSEALSVDDDTVTVRATSLSIFQGASVPFTYISAPSVTEASLLRQRIGEFIGIRAAAPSCNPDSTSDSLINTGGSAIVEGGVVEPTVRYCVERDGAVARWRIANNTGAVLNIRTESNDNRFTGMMLSGDVLLDLAFESWNGIGPNGKVEVDVPPGGGVVLTVPQNSVEDQVSVKESVLTPSAFSLKQVSRLLPDGTAKLVWAAFNDCRYSIGSSVSLSSVFSCVQVGLDAAGPSLAKEAADVVSTAAALLSGLGTAADQLRLGMDPKVLTVQYIKQVFPPPPGGGGDGDGVPSYEDGRLPANPFDIQVAIARQSPSGVAGMVRDGTYYGIIDRVVYICLAQTLPVRDNVLSSTVLPGNPNGGRVYPNLFWYSESMFPAGYETCATRVIPSNARNWILRNGETGESWLLDGSGALRPIPDGGTYLCLADRYFVLDWINESDLGKFPAGSTATCP